MNAKIDLQKIHSISNLIAIMTGWFQCQKCERNFSSQKVLFVHSELTHAKKVVDFRNYEKRPKTETGPTPIIKESKNQGNEKFWCVSCSRWVNGGKANMTKHLRKIHEEENCQVIFVNSRGMLRVDKKDFLPKEKEASVMIKSNNFLTKTEKKIGL